MDHGDIENTGQCISASAKLTDCLFVNSKKCRQPCTPLIEQLLSVYQNKRIRAPLRNESCPDNSLAEARRRRKYSRVVLQQRCHGVFLFRQKLSFELRVETLSYIPLIVHNGLNPQIREHGRQLLEAASRQGQVFFELFGTGNNPGRIERRAPHGLRFVEFRILKRGKSDNSVDEAGRQIVLLDEQQVGLNHRHPLRQLAVDRRRLSAAGWRNHPRAFIHVITYAHSDAHDASFPRGFLFNQLHQGLGE